MARPSAEKKQKVYKLLPQKQMWAILDNAMTTSGMYQHIMQTPELMHMIQKKETSLREDKKINPDTSHDEFMYLSRLPVARKLIADDNNWMIRVVSDAKRLSPVNIVKEEFLKYGPSALPAHYKYARNFGGVFEWHPESNVTIIMMLRGLGKSHNEVVCRSLTDFVNDPSEKCLIGHSEDDKAEELIKRIRDALFHPNLMVIYPEFFVDDIDYYRARGVEIKKDRINLRTLDFKNLTRVIDPSDYMRGEATWSLFTPRVDVTGQHYNRIKLDDFVTEKNSKTWERASKIIDVFDSLAGLEEYVIDEKTGETKGIPIQITDTQYAIPNMITHALENRNVTAFIMPMTWDPDEHKTIYSYCKEHKYRIDPKIVTDKFIDRKKKDFGSEERFLSQAYMIGIRRNTIIELVKSKSEFMFAFADEDVHESVNKVKFTQEFLNKRAANILSKDPSYSDKKKDMNTAVSKDTTIRAHYYDGKYYVTFGEQVPGAPTQERQLAPILRASKGIDIDAITMDSRAYQFYIVDGIYKELKRVHWKNMKAVWYDFFDKASDSKIELAQEVLGSMFASGLIKVHHSLSELIKEIMREAPGFDYLDTLIQMCSLDTMRLRARSNHKKFLMEDDESNLQVIENSSSIFSVTNY